MAYQNRSLFLLVHALRRPLPRTPHMQIIVAVTSSYKLICLDHNLAIMWAKDLTPNFPEHSPIADVALHVSYHKVGETDVGMVVLAAEVKPPSAAPRVLRGRKGGEVALSGRRVTCVLGLGQTYVAA